MDYAHGLLEQLLEDIKEERAVLLAATAEPHHEIEGDVREFRFMIKRRIG